MIQTERKGGSALLVRLNASRRLKAAPLLLVTTLLLTELKLRSKLKLTPHGAELKLRAS